jgi:drug/metabolite transporter (DMT)-like permease
MTSSRSDAVPGAGAYGVLVLIQLLFASLAITGRWVLPVVPPGLLLMLRAVGAAAALLLLNAIRGGPWLRDRAVLKHVAFSALLGVTANQAFFLFGLRYTTAVNATILVTTVPVFTVLGSLLLGRERPSRLKLSGIGLAALGAIYLVGPDRFTFEPGAALGNLLILVGMVCFAGYFILFKPLVSRHDTVTLATYVMVFAAAGSLPIGIPSLARLDPGSVSGSIWLLVGYIVLFPTIGTYFLNLWALQRASSNTVASFIYLQPLFTALASPIFLPAERIGPRTLVAGAAIFAGLALVIQAERSQEMEVPVAPGVGE